MYNHRINLILLGIGNIGSTLINQVIESQDFFEANQKINLQFPIIANSTHAWFGQKELSDSWKDNFEKNAIPYKALDITKYFQENNLENTILIDVTASKSITNFYLHFIQQGFDIVSANKIPNTLSQAFYQDIRENLRRYDKTYLYESTVGAGLPIIKTIKEMHYSNERITKIRGVFSGSLSYIFNTFGTQDFSFSDILEKAEKTGYTEPDSRQDLSGNDVARKMLILARELHANLEFSDIKITTLLLPELNETNAIHDYAVNKSLFNKPYQIAKISQEKNHVLRYVGKIDLLSKKYSAKLESVPINSSLGQLKGTDNLIEIYSDSYANNPMVIQGAGAGKEVTARSVLSDILKITELMKLKTLVY